MKVFKIVSKNLKLLLRSKTALLVLIFGPLLIMLFVGFAFNNPAVSKLNIGYHTDENTNLTTSFVDALKANPNFLVVEYPTEQACSDMIAQGKVHVCIIFPKSFVIENNKTNEITFYVDQSRANFVYAVIDTVSTKIDLTSTQLSYQMTNDLITVIKHSKEHNDATMVSVIKLKNSVNEISLSLESIKTKLNSIDLSNKNIPVGALATNATSITADVNSLKSRGKEAADMGSQLVEDLRALNLGGNMTPILDVFDDNISIQKDFINNASDDALADISSLNDLIDSISEDVTALNKKLATAKSATSDSGAKITEIQTKLLELKTELDLLKSGTESANAEINALKITSAESIVNPITTIIKPINTKSNNLNFILPYLIILIIMFISIMLSSTMIVMEKTSKAYFRNFTSPTKDFTFILATFITTLFVVVIQIIFILGLAYYFLNASILSNIGLSAALILGAIALFTLLGMLIGYSFSSQEGVTMASISIGSVLLFLSNLILPVESISVYLQEIARYNPYVICSELLKKLTLFNSKWADVTYDFLLLGIYLVLLFILMMIIQRVSKMQYIKKRQYPKPMKHDDIIDKYFKMKSGVLVKNESELLEELKTMSDLTFGEYVDKKKNDFETWLIMNKKHALAKKVGNATTREGLITLLEKEQKDKESKDSKDSKKK